MSPKTTIWTVLSEEDKEKPLKDFEGTDILTSKTAREIKDNNDKSRL